MAQPLRNPGASQDAACWSPAFQPAATADADAVAAASDAAPALMPLDAHTQAPCSLQCVRRLLRHDLDAVLQVHHDEFMRRLESWADRQEQRLCAGMLQPPPEPMQTPLRGEATVLPPGSIAEAHPPHKAATNREAASTLPTAARAEEKPPEVAVESDWVKSLSRDQPEISRKTSLSRDRPEISQNNGEISTGKRAGSVTDNHRGSAHKTTTFALDRRPSKETAYTSDGKTRASKNDGLIAWLHRSMTQHEQTNYAESRRKSQSVKAAVNFLKKHTTAFGEYGGARTQLQIIVGHNVFECLICALIVSNAVFFGVEVQYAAHVGVNNAPGAFAALQYVYTTLFSLELALRLFAEGTDFFVSTYWAWNYLDLLIVMVSLLESVLDIVRSASETEVDSSNLAYIRIIRIVRTVRILRVVRLMRFFRSLRILIYSIVHTLKSLMWTLCLLVAIMYVFGVLFTQATAQHVSPVVSAKDGERSSLTKYYGTLPRSMFTLFMCISGGVDWEMVLEPLREIHAFWVLLFIVFISFTFFAVLNVVTGVFCQNAIESAAHDRDMVVQAQLASKENYIQELIQLFGMLDGNHSGALTIEEFEEHFYNDKVQAYFNSLELNLSDAWTLFKLLDNDDSRLVSITEFVEGCVRLKGTARSIDMAAMRYEQKWMLNKLNKFMIYVENQFNEIGHKMPSPPKPLKSPDPPPADLRLPEQSATAQASSSGGRGSSSSSSPKHKGNVAWADQEPGSRRASQDPAAKCAECPDPALDQPALQVKHRAGAESGPEKLQIVPMA